MSGAGKLESLGTLASDDAPSFVLQWNDTLFYWLTVVGPAPR